MNHFRHPHYNKQPLRKNFYLLPNIHGNSTHVDSLKDTKPFNVQYSNEQWILDKWFQALQRYMYMCVCEVVAENHLRKASLENDL